MTGFGVSARHIGQDMSTAFEGQLAPRYPEAGDHLNLVVKLEGDENSLPTDVRLLPIATSLL